MLKRLADSTREGFWKGCKPNSVCFPRPKPRKGEDHLSQQPIPETRPAVKPDLGRAAPGSPIWPCSRWGFPCPWVHTQSGGLLPRLFTLTQNLLPVSGRFVLCGTLRDSGITPSPRVYPRPVDRGYVASRPMEFGLSSPGEAWSDPPPFQNQVQDGTDREPNPGLFCAMLLSGEKSSI